MHVTRTCRAAGSLLTLRFKAAVTAAFAVLLLNGSAAQADVVSEYAALRSFVEAAGCESYFETYFGWTTSLLSPSTTVGNTRSYFFALLVAGLARMNTDVVL